MTIIETFMLILSQCEQHQLSLKFEFDNGKYVPGDVLLRFGSNIDAIPESEVQQGPTGYRIAIAGYYYQDKNSGEETIYPDFKTAVGVGYQLLMTILAKKQIPS